MSVLSTPAILLRSFPYSESSTVLKFYSLELGVTSVMARGARSSQSRGRTALATFSEGTLTLFVKPGRDLQTFKDFAPTNPRRELAGDVVRFAGASVLGELVLRVAGEERSPDLYSRLAGSLDRLSASGAGDPVADFLAEAWGLVDALGYRPELSSCTVCGRGLDADEMSRFDFAAGGVRCSLCAEGAGGPRLGAGARAQLDALLDGQVPADLSHVRAHVKLLGDFVTYHVSDGRPLQSLAFLTDLLPPAHA